MVITVPTNRWKIISRKDCVNEHDKQFSSNHNKQRHVKKEHNTEINIGVLLIRNESTEEESTENVCKVCPIPQKFK